jgi:hypothetical protein
MLWPIAWILLGSGALIVAGGLVLFARNFHLRGETRLNVGLAYSAAALAVVGASCYLIIALLGIIQPAEDFVRGSETYINSLATFYGILTLTAVFIFGVVLFMSRRRIAGGFLLIAPVASLVTGLYQVPLTNYIPLLIVGIALLVRTGQQEIPGTAAELES